MNMKIYLGYKSAMQLYERYTLRKPYVSYKKVLLFIERFICLKGRVREREGKRVLPSADSLLI